LAAKNIKIARPTLFNYIFKRDEFEKYVSDWFALLQGPEKVNIKIHKTYPLADAGQAQTVRSQYQNIISLKLTDYG